MKVTFDDGTTSDVDALAFEAYFSRPPQEEFDEASRPLPVHNRNNRSLRKPPVRALEPWQDRRAEYLARKA